MPHFLEQFFRKRDLKDNNVYVGDIHDTAGHKRAFICFLRGIMVFLASYATIFGLMDAFDLPFNRPLIIGFLFVISMSVAFLYLNKILFYAGYISILVVFTWQLVYLYLYANSGYQAITNVIYEHYSDFYKLLGLRQGQEFYSSRYETVTVALFFIGTFLALLLNVTISGYMNLLETMLITFPFLEIAFFIYEKPPLHCVLILISVYVCVAIQQASKHFRMQVKGRHTKEFLRFRKKNKIYYSYQSSAKGSLYTLLFSLVSVFAIGLCFSPLYYAEKPLTKPNVFRTEIDNMVKIYVESGVGGLFDRYDNVGGLGDGRLGGVSSVRPDFQTDLTVRFVPYNYDTVYLKAFTGSYYISNQWYEHSYSDTPEENVKELYLSDEEIYYYDTLYMPDTYASGKMEITNHDLAEKDVLFPYYSANGKTSFPLDSTMTINYSPYDSQNMLLSDEELEEEYEIYINNRCTDIPPDLHIFLMYYMLEHDIGRISDAYYPSSDTPSKEDINNYRLYAASEIYTHFMREFEYTMAPGSTPANEEFIYYFLNDQKKGFCAHFASAATMMLRAKGIPARYVEGYCIPVTLIAEGTAVPYDSLDEWYTGPTSLDEQGVIEVLVDDSYAHAWVEVYLEGYGFVPVEVTPASEDDSMGIPDVGGLFAGLFDINFNIAQLPESGESSGNNTLTTFGKLFIPSAAKTVALPLAIFVGILVLVAGGYGLFLSLREQIRLKKCINAGQYNEPIYKHFNTLSALLKKKFTTTKPLQRVYPDYPDNPLPDELCKLIDLYETYKRLPKQDRKRLNASDLSRLEKLTPAESPHAQEFERFVHLTERGLYSQKGLTSAEYEEYVLLMKSLHELIRKKP